MWKTLLICMALATATGTAGEVRAASFEARNFDALAVEAEQVIVGTATSQVSRRTGEREIVTDYRFDNIEVVKGASPGTSLTLTMLGGSVGVDTLSVAGAPKFISGMRYLVFVSGNGSVMFPLVGGPQGIFQIRREAASGVSQVYDYAGKPVTQLPGRRPDEKADTVNAESLEPMSQAAFVEAIRARIAVSSQGAK